MYLPAPPSRRKPIPLSQFEVFGTRQLSNPVNLVWRWKSVGFPLGLRWDSIETPFEKLAYITLRSTLGYLTYQGGVKFF